MGSKTTTTKTELPPPTAEERAQTAQFNALLDAQMSQNYTKQESQKFVYEKQDEIDQIDNQIAQLSKDPNNRANYGQLQKLYGDKQNLIQEGGHNEVSVQYIEKPEVTARREAQQQESDQIDKLFFQNAQKLLNGDFSLSDTQRSQIKQIVGDNFDPIMDLAKTQYSSAKDEVNNAVQRLTDAGKLDMLKQVTDQTTALKQQNALLGRSTSDQGFQRSIADLNQRALERLYSTDAATAASAVGSIGSQEASALTNIASAKGQAGYNLSLQAAQPLGAFGAGAQYSQLQGALNAQNTANAQVPVQDMLSRLGQLGSTRAAQPTTTQTQPFGVLDVLGALAGAASSTFSGLNAFGKI